ncbi:MAG: hypothetical protein ACRCZD_09125, partial [Phycicoccus sp.]
MPTIRSRPPRVLIVGAVAALLSFGTGSLPTHADPGYVVAGENKAPAVTGENAAPTPSDAAREIGTYSQVGYRSGHEHAQWTTNVAPWKTAAMATDGEIYGGPGQYKPWFAMYHNGNPGTITVDDIRLYAHDRDSGRWERLTLSYPGIGGAFWDPNWGDGTGTVGDGGRPMIYGPDGGLAWTTAAERDDSIIHGWANGTGAYGGQYDGYLVTMTAGADRTGHTVGMGIDRYNDDNSFGSGGGVSAPWSVPAGSTRMVGVTNRPDLL